MIPVRWSLAVFCLLAMDVLVVALYGLHVQLGGWPSILDLDRERNLGAWWGGGKFLLAGQAVAMVIAVAKGLSRAERILYAVITFGFVFLSIDEILGLHENITRYALSANLSVPMFNQGGAWISVYAGIFLLFLVGFGRQILNLIRYDRQSVGTVFFGFALVVLGGVVVEVFGYYNFGVTRGSDVQVGLEETLELIGASIIVLGCWFHCAKRLSSDPSPF
ncbi:MAG: hypothetical protein GY947_04910 [Rhodobacteraceae bacterium]|nr:hypothetical protein [Paracoccaceae bacterium]